MAINKNTRPVVELDFDQIKTDVISFIKSDPTFTDYNFEGSALNTIADMLAYNTFNNAYYANMLHAEGFLDSAQKRASVVSRAKELGYTPVSATCSTAFVDIEVTTTGTTTPFYVLRGQTFSAANDSGTFIFSVADSVTASINGNTQTLSGVKLVNGTNIQNRFTVDTQKNVRSIFSIPNKNVDISTLKVYVKDSISSVERVEYQRAIDLYSLVPTSNIYFVQESYDGTYQIYFGSNIFGVQPVNGNIIEIDYFIASNSTSSNGCTQFYYSGSFPTATNVDVITTQPSIGGAEKEDIDSIKFNAKRTNAAKNRIITKNDYALEISTQFPFIKSAAVWGGEENVPPIYGKVFVQIQPVSGYILSDGVKKSTIIPAIRKKSMMTIQPEIVDPYYTFMEFSTRIKFDASKSSKTLHEMEYVVKETIKTYIDQISKFDTDFLEPELISTIMSSNAGIVSIDIYKKVGFDISPTAGTPTRIQYRLNNPIQPGTITSSKFTYFFNGATGTGYIGDIPSSSIPVKTLGVFDSSGKLIGEVGTVDIQEGVFDFTVNVYEYLYDAQKIQIRMKCEGDDIIVKRNQILTMDLTSSINNTVVTELYAK